MDQKQKSKKGKASRIVRAMRRWLANASAIAGDLVRVAALPLAVILAWRGLAHHDAASLGAAVVVIAAYVAKGD
jgi:hypothetical protein